MSDKKNVAMAATIKILDVKKFIEPLSGLKGDINSIIFSKSDDTFHVNCMSEDGSQKVNIWYTPEIINIEDGGDTIEKLGIYNLAEFLSVLNLFDDQKTERIDVVDNKLTIHFNEKSKINYILTDIIKNPDLIVEGPSKNKKEIPFVASFEVNENFVKKVGKISNSLNIKIKIIKFVIKDGELSYVITDDTDHAHDYTEVLLDGLDCEDTEIAMTVKDDHRNNIGLLMSSCGYKIGIHPRVIQFESVSENYEKVRYYLSPRED